MYILYTLFFALPMTGYFCEYKVEIQLIMNNLTFVLSEESVNSFGFVVQTNGIDLERFKKNPVMLYQHKRESGIIGRWENIRIEGTQLLADAVFDESEPLGLKIKTKVEGGFIRSVSIGISEVQQSAIKGVETVISCVLDEVSVVDIPSNRNAVKLRKSGGKYCLSLGALDEVESNDLRSGLLQLLELEEKADDNTILEAIESLLNSVRAADNEIEQALRLGLIDSNQKKVVLAMHKYDREGFDSFLAGRKETLAKDVVKLVDKAVNNSKIIHYERGVYEDIGNSLGVAVLRKLLNTLPKAIKPLDVIEGGRGLSPRTEWDLEDYRRFAPEELSANPELYNRLTKTKKQDKEGYTLDWYRRNNPEYLLQHPDIYERLLAK